MTIQLASPLQPRMFTQDRSPFPNKTRTTSTPSIRFGAHIDLKEYVSPSQFWKLVKKLPEPYVGELPAPLLQTQIERKEVLKTLDQLGSLLRQLDAPELPDISFKIGAKTIRCHSVGAGWLGRAYRFSTDDEAGQPISYVFKTYHNYDYDRFNPSCHGPVGETMLGVLLKNVVDIPQFHISNPHSGQCWSLLEWIEPDTPLERRKGERLKEALKSFGLNLYDDHAGNSIGKIRIDLGGISKMRTVGFWIDNIKNFTRILFSYLFYAKSTMSAKAIRLKCQELKTIPDDKQELRQQALQTIQLKLNQLVKRKYPKLNSIKVLPVN